MAQTFVYNSGSFTPPNKNEITLSFGLFFDGTNTNLFSTRARKRTYKIEEYADQSKEENRATLLDKKLTKEYSEGTEWNWKSMGYQTKDNSYNTDFTNIARQYLCVDKENYGIYIEGIGTQPAPSKAEERTTEEKQLRNIVDRLEDDLYPKGFGTGKTGIRKKVLRGCDELAKRIIDKKKNLKSVEENGDTISTIVLDVFGFSRGAAAARNFLYEINGNKRADDIATTTKEEVVDSKEVKTPNGYFSHPIKEKVTRTKDGVKVISTYLDNGKLPKFGYLGYLLLKSTYFTKEELKNLQLEIRFIGLYDTVSSYEDKDFSIFNKKGFNSGIDSLQLNNIGNFGKAVHFTAADEHRFNFSLTQLEPDNGKEVMEKVFPGVHSDIGGSYANFLKPNEEMKENVIVELIPTISGDLLYGKIGKIKKELAESYFWKKEELEAVFHWETFSSLEKNEYLSDYIGIKGTRKVYKEYSYIPLHFMEALFNEKLQDDANSILVEKTEQKYPIKGYPLVDAKKRLHSYVFGNAEEWKFVDDAKVNFWISIDNIPSHKESKEKQREKDQELKEASKDRISNQQHKPAHFYVEDKAYEAYNQKVSKVNTDKPMEQKKIITARVKEQWLLRALRHNYLHWSADHFQAGMEPSENKKREIFNKKHKERVGFLTPKVLLA